MSSMFTMSPSSLSAPLSVPSFNSLGDSSPIDHSSFRFVVIGFTSVGSDSLKYFLQNLNFHCAAFSVKDNVADIENKLGTFIVGLNRIDAFIIDPQLRNTENCELFGRVLSVLYQGWEYHKHSKFIFPSHIDSKSLLDSVGILLKSVKSANGTQGGGGVGGPKKSLALPVFSQAELDDDKPMETINTGSPNSLTVPSLSSSLSRQSAPNLLRAQTAFPQSHSFSQSPNPPASPLSASSGPSLSPSSSFVSPASPTHQTHSGGKKLLNNKMQRAS